MIEELPDDIENDVLDDIAPVGDESQLYEHFSVVVDKGQEMVRVDKYLFVRLTNASRIRLQNAADAGFVCLSADWNGFDRTLHRQHHADGLGENRHMGRGTPVAFPHSPPDSAGNCGKRYRQRHTFPGGAAAAGTSGDSCCGSLRTRHPVCGICGTG